MKYLKLENIHFIKEIGTVIYPDKAIQDLLKKKKVLKLSQDIKSCKFINSTSIKSALKSSVNVVMQLLRTFECKSVCSE